MVIELNRWLRRLLVAQPTLVWPLSFVLWSAGGHGLVAVILLWLSAIVSIAGIILPMRYAPVRGDRCQRC